MGSPDGEQEEWDPRRPHQLAIEDLKFAVSAASYLSSQTCGKGHTEGSGFCVGSSRGFNFQTPDIFPPPDPPGRWRGGGRGRVAPEMGVPWV